MRRGTSSAGSNIEADASKLKAKYNSAMTETDGLITVIKKTQSDSDEWYWANNDSNLLILESKRADVEAKVKADEF